MQLLAHITFHEIALITGIFLAGAAAGCYAAWRSFMSRDDRDR
jgi:hypothetical protein